MKQILQNIRLTLKEWASYIPGFLTLIFIIALGFFIGKLYFMAVKWRKVLYEHVTSTDINSNTMTIPEGADVYVIQPQGEQEVIIIGDPDDIKVKPKKK